MNQKSSGIRVTSRTVGRLLSEGLPPGGTAALIPIGSGQM